MHNRALEIIFGVLCLGVIISFSVYIMLVLYNSDNDTYQVTAKFNNIGGVNNGSIVSIRGVKIGTIVDIKLDSQTYEVIVRLKLDKTINIPNDSILFVDKAGLFSPPMLAIISGTSKNFLHNNSQILYTKDWVSLEDKIANIFLNPSN